MTDKEKAQAYDEALKRARKILDEILDNEILGFPDQIREIFPQLRESEDERIRKFLVDFFASYKIGDAETKLNGVRIDDILAYLEKQKEHHFELKAGKWYICYRAFCARADHLTVKEGERFQCEKDGIVKGFVIKEPEKYFKECSAPEPMEKEQKQEWSDEDADMLNCCISSIEEAKENRYAYKETDGDTSYDREIDWLKSLRPQPHSEWRHYIWATNLRFDFTALIKYDNTDNYEIVQAGNRPKQEKNGVYILIKDIKPQPSWKPSEEQLEELNKMRTLNPGLDALYQQLKNM